jgi:nucleotide-binding universal stress UspA family protein
MTKLKVLIPTDFSVQAEFAYLMVKKLGEKIEIETHFLHVLDVPDTVSLNAQGQIETCGDIDTGFVNSQKEIAERKLATLKTLYGDDIHTHFVLGKLTDQIVSYSESNHYDLIVMGTKGAWGIKDKLSGTETQMVARQSKVPVLSMMCDRSQLVIENILLVHNFAQPENEGLILLNNLIQAFHPKIHLLQIVQDESENLYVLSQMDEFAKLNGIINYEKHLLKDSDVENGVIHFNQMHDMDIICIGTQGRKGIERLIHPSATEKLINHLFKPIISFHLAK